MKKTVAVITMFFTIAGFLLTGSAGGITISQEEKISREFLRAVHRRYEVINDPQIADYVNSISLT